MSEDRFVDAATNDSILVAGDAPERRQMARGLFQRVGYSSIEASNPQDLIARMIDSHPAAVILDIDMPGIDAEATLCTLKQLRPTMPVMVMTGRTALGLLEAWVRLLGATIPLGRLRPCGNRQRPEEAQEVTVAVCGR